MNPKSRLFLLCSFIFALTCRAEAGVFIDQPKSTTVWLAGEREKIEFRSTQKVVKTQIKIISEGKSRTIGFDEEVKPESENPHVVRITVPESLVAAGKVERFTVQVSVTDPDGAIATDQIKIQIKHTKPKSK